MTQATQRTWGLVVIVAAALLAGCTTVDNSKSAVEIRAAQTSKHPDWQKLDFYVGGLNTWVAKEPTIVCSDIDSAKRSLDGFGEPTVVITFTAEGAKKMDALTTERMSRPIAVILDGKIVAAPIVTKPVTDTLVVGFGKESSARSTANKLADTINNKCSKKSSTETSSEESGDDSK